MTERADIRQLSRMQLITAALEVLVTASGDPRVRVEANATGLSPLSPAGRQRLLDGIEVLVKAVRSDAGLNGHQAVLDRIAAGIGMDPELERTVGGTD